MTSLSFPVPCCAIPSYCTYHVLTCCMCLAEICMLHLHICHICHICHVCHICHICHDSSCVSCVLSGREVAAGLMKEGAHVVMACRNMTSCEAVKQQLEQQAAQGTCECSKYELASNMLSRGLQMEDVFDHRTSCLDAPILPTVVPGI